MGQAYGAHPARRPIQLHLRSYQRWHSAARSCARSLRHRIGFATLLKEAEATDPAPPLSIGEFGVIAEIKFRSPSGRADHIGTSACASVRADRYARAGASAISVLTEPSCFGGGISHLAVAAQAAAVCGVPAMRKDFLVDPVQLAEARVAGAGGVLLIARLLCGEHLGEMLAVTMSLGMFAIVEVFDRADLDAVSDALLGGIHTGTAVVRPRSAICGCLSRSDAQGAHWSQRQRSSVSRSQTTESL